MDAFYAIVATLAVSSIALIGIVILPGQWTAKQNLVNWLRDRDSNPDCLIQSQVSYH